MAEQDGGGEKAEAEQRERHHQRDDHERRPAFKHDQGCRNRADREQLERRIEDEDRGHHPNTADDELGQRMEGAQHSPCSSQRPRTITAGCSRSARASSA
jgi:hypothetical protein